ncbi:uncharacterized protein DUF4305 [Melghiribacillus thermohalophilus]|uniref:Uncharacterized protein DUF4305 n=1 Tax=Melghiribacillus thermohalophilus TaxID=1324956 RepID=A0A4R3MRR9_9BACI|nr:YdiK family protein [Melghiribacillus thermohalophilus]TCT18944.1 uncharacterized protein DUF4305 [Melghiribacillus thermohalophilus]
MKASPLLMSALYFFIGILFTYLAIQSVEETIWNWTTVILSIVATFDFAIAIRLLGLHFFIKNSNKE